MISIFFLGSVILLSNRSPSGGRKTYEVGVAALLLIMWIVNVILLTFYGAFYKTGNGYFSTWFGLFCCISNAFGGSLAKAGPQQAESKPPVVTVGQVDYAAKTTEASTPVGSTALPPV